MVRHPNIKFAYLFIQVIAVAIICLGSLINFHQYKIWGKPLIPTFIGYKRDIEKYSKTFSYSKFSRNDHVTQQHFSGPDAVIAPEVVIVSYGTISSILTDYSREIPISFRTCSCGLRAPPVI